uniref:Solute carrier family 29 (equilibrative nucleoside transporter), member 3 n=1 Tax=Xenopus tropicalis TaxID=8364 RepID=A0A803JEA5_XENTR
SAVGFGGGNSCSLHCFTGRGRSYLCVTNTVAESVGRGQSCCGNGACEHSVAPSSRASCISQSISQVSEDYLQSANSIYKPSDHIHSDSEQESLLGEHRVKPYRIHKPVDHYCCTYIIFFLLGIGTSLPWNFFCTAKHYWIYKFRNCTDAPLIERHDASDISDYFESYFSIASAVPSVPCLILNFFLVNRVSSKVRILSSLVVILLVFVLTTVLVKVDTSAWTKEFFVLTLSCVVILSGAANILAASIFGITGQFPMKNSQALVSGKIVLVCGG